MKKKNKKAKKDINHRIINAISVDKGKHGNKKEIILNLNY